MNRLKCAFVIFSLVWGGSIFVKISSTLGNSPTEPLFTVKLTVPSSGTGLQEWHYSFVIERELPKIGINAEIDEISWAALGPRATDQEVGMNSEGGYDICFFGMSLGTPKKHPGNDIQRVYGSTAIPPAGYNVMYWSPETGKNYNNYRAQESDDLIKQLSTNLNLTETKKDLIEWQKIWYDVMPNIPIYNLYELHAVSTGLYGYDPVKYPLSSIEDIWLTTDYTGTASQVVLAAKYGSDTFNPMMTISIYDWYANNPVFDGLVGNTPSREAVLPADTNRDTWMMTNYNTNNYLELYPRVAEAIGTWSADGLSYGIDVRKGVYWHDGHELDAWDVAFSFQARLIPLKNKWNSFYNRDRDEWLRAFGHDEKTGNHGNYSFTITDENADGFYERVTFHFNQICAAFETDFLGSFLFPEHILGNPVNHGFNITGDFDPVNQWTVPPDEWPSHATTTGQIIHSGYHGPIGCGSMIFIEYNDVQEQVILKKFKDIRWDNTSRQWVSTPGISHWNIANLDAMPDQATVIVVSMDSALADMKTGGVNIMDPRFQMASILDELQEASAIQHISSVERGWQGVWLNPKFEFQGTHPLGKKGVRHAISHAIPRENLTTRYLNFVTPAYTPLPQTSWGAISEPEMVEYKKTLKATDGTTPLANSTTAYDEYSIDLALDWLETEGYDTTPWREKSTTTLKITGFELLITTLTLTSGGLLFKHRRQGALS